MRYHRGTYRSGSAVAGPASPPLTHVAPLSGPLGALVARLGQVLGDAAPRSTLSRVARIGQCYGVDEPLLAERLTEAARRMRDTDPEITRRTPSGTPNGMPYLLTTLESLLQPSPEPADEPLPPGPVASHPEILRPGAVAPPPGPFTTPSRTATAAQLEPSPLVTAELSASLVQSAPSAVPLWAALLAAMREIVAPGVQRVLEHELVATVEGDSLVLSAPSQFRAAWIERSLRRHLEDRLAALSPKSFSLRIVAIPACAGT